MRRRTASRTKDHATRGTRRGLARVLLAVAGAFVVLGTPAAHASGPRADVLFESGRAALARGDYAAACVCFLESQRLEPALGTLLNVSLCHEKQGHLVAATAALADAVAQLPADDARAAFAREHLDALRRRTPSLVLALEPGAARDGALVARDGETLPAAALGAPLAVDPGTHELVVRTPGHVDARQAVVVREGERRTLTLDAGPRLGDAASARGAGSATADVTAGGSRSATRTALTVGAFGVGAASLAVGVVTGVLTVDAARTYSDHCPDTACDDEGRRAAARGATLEIVSPVALAVGAVGVGAGLVLLLTARTQGATRVSLSPRASSRDAGFVVEGRF